MKKYMFLEELYKSGEPPLTMRHERLVINGGKVAEGKRGRMGNGNSFRYGIRSKEIFYELHS